MAVFGNVHLKLNVDKKSKRKYDLPKGNSNNFGTLSTEDREKGSIQSGQSRKKNKSIREALKALLSGKVEYEGEQMGGNDALALSVFNKALKGDVQDTIELEDTRVQNVEINFVDKSRQREEAEEDPKIIGEYTNGIDTEDSG